jgi:hypothetical protein
MANLFATLHFHFLFPSIKHKNFCHSCQESVFSMHTHQTPCSECCMPYINKLHPSAMFSFPQNQSIVRGRQKEMQTGIISYNDLFFTRLRHTFFAVRLLVSCAHFCISIHSSISVRKPIGVMAFWKVASAIQIRTNS